MKSFFEGRATFAVEGCDSALLNRLRKFCISDICLDESCNQLRFTCPLRFLNNVKIILARQKYSVCVNKNFFGFLNVFYSRLTFSVAAVICTVIFFVLNGLVFNVKIVGVEGEQAAKVASFVKSQGARPFIHKSNSRAVAIAGKITGNFDFVAHASSKIVGNTLIFNIYSVTVAEEAKVHDITATTEGIITNIIVASGRAMVSVGDVVQKGQVLIKAERQVGAIDIGRDEFGKLIQEGIFSPSRAVGEVLADVKYSEFGISTNIDELLAKITMRTGIQKFDKVEQFSAGAGILEVVATVNQSIVCK